MAIRYGAALTQLSKAAILSLFAALLYASQIGCGDLAEEEEDDSLDDDPVVVEENADPAAAIPANATAWKLVNTAVGHEDGPYAIPGVPNPDGFPVVDPKSEFFAAAETGSGCEQIHLHSPGSVLGGLLDHSDPDGERCGHGVLVYIDVPEPEPETCTQAPQNVAGTYNGSYSCTNTIRNTDTYASLPSCSPTETNGSFTLILTQTGNSVTVSDSDGGSYTGTVCGSSVSLSGGIPGDFTETANLVISGAEASKTSYWQSTTSACQGTCTDTLSFTPE